jgi:hypothetical protein
MIPTKASERESFTLTKVEIEGIPNAHILESDSIDSLLVVPGRHLLGYRRQLAAFTATVTWIDALHAAKELPENLNELCTVTVMAEGCGHNLPTAVGCALDGAHYRGDNWIGVSRFALPNREGQDYTDFDAKVTYMRMHSAAPVWLMLDTIATGATLIKGLTATFENCKKPKRILLAATCGSVVGTRKIVEFLQSEKIEVHVTFWGAAFGLWNDGTGLPWCHPDTIISGTTRGVTNRQIAGRLFNEIPGFCAVGDCSANFFDVEDAKRVLKEEEYKFSWRLPTL